MHRKLAKAALTVGAVGAVVVVGPAVARSVADALASLLSSAANGLARGLPGAVGEFSSNLLRGAAELITPEPTAISVYTPQVYNSQVAAAVDARNLSDADLAARGLSRRRVPTEAERLSRYQWLMPGEPYRLRGGRDRDHSYKVGQPSPFPTPSDGGVMSAYYVIVPINFDAEGT